jgi:hypothetical protein
MGSEDVEGENKGTRNFLNFARDACWIPVGGAGINLIAVKCLIFNIAYLPVRQLLTS